jgi:hypothetical protein
MRPSTAAIASPPPLTHIRMARVTALGALCLLFVAGGAIAGGGSPPPPPPTGGSGTATGANGAAGTTVTNGVSGATGGSGTHGGGGSNGGDKSQPPSFTWTVQPPPSAWSLAAGNPVSIEIMVGAVPATEVKLAVCSFVEQSTKTPLGCDRLQLCPQPAGDCTPVPQLNSGAHPLFLRGTGSIDPGTYLGSLTITSKEDPKGYTSPAITLYQTTPGRRFLGVLAILFGVALAWWVTSYARSRVARDQALLPAALLSTQLVELRARLDASPARYRDRTAETRAAIQDLLDLLTEAYLEGRNFIPPRFPNPFGGTAVDGAGYKNHIEALNSTVALLALIVRQGLVPAWTPWQPGLPDALQTAIDTAVHDIDALAALAPLPSLDAARQRIDAALAALNNALHPPAPGAVAFAAAAQGGAPPPLSFERLSVGLANLELSVWAVWFLVTGLAGSAALVFSNLGFGTPLDYVQCLLWGFGIPAAGQQLLQASVGSVSQAVGVSIVKS